jgi:uncharacterized protein
MKYSTLLLLAFLSFQISIVAQNSKVAEAKKVSPKDTLNKPNLVLITRNYGDSVVLRWAPTDPIFWKIANQVGYTVKKFTMVKQVPKKWEILNRGKPIKPDSLEQWQVRYGTDNKFAAMAAELLWGQASVKIDPKVFDLSKAMERSYELENKLGFALFLADLSAPIADGMGLRLVDKDVKKDEVYVYEIVANTKDQAIASDTARAVVVMERPDPKERIPSVEVKNFDRTCTFTWKKSKYEKPFSAYYFERSDDGGKTYKRTQDLPKVFFHQENNGLANPNEITFTDSLAQNYKQYYFRIQGINAFGDYSEYSPPLPVMGIDLTPPSPLANVKAEHQGGTEVKLTWKETGDLGELKGYVVCRGTEVNGPFLPIMNKPLPVGTKSWTDSSVVTYLPNFYQIASIDTAGNLGYSLVTYANLVDTVPPAKPLGLTGMIDTLGRVTIKWQPNYEPDVLGYLVYKANARDHTFAVITPDFLADTIFYDSITLKVLTREIYYRIVCFDKNRNASPRSDILELIKPDVVPPVSAVIGNYFVTDTTVYFNWRPSTSKDLAKQVLYRKEHINDEWQAVKTLDKTVKEYTDATVQRRKTYLYAIESIDETDLKSPMSYPLSVKVYDSGRRPDIKDLKVVYDKEKKEIVLNWNYPLSNDVKYYLYRAFDKEDVELLDAITGSNTFNDKKIRRKGAYTYSLKAIYKDGGESPVIEAKPVLVE